MTQETVWVWHVEIVKQTEANQYFIDIKNDEKKEITNTKMPLS